MMPAMPPDGFADEPGSNGPPDGFADEGQPGQQEQSTFDKINNSFPGVRRGLQVGLDTLNAPFELAGEAVRQAASGGQFRLPTVAKDLGADVNNRYLTTQQQPMNMFSVPRKAIEAGIQGVRALPQGIGAAGQAASDEFSRTNTNPVEALTDLGTAVGMGMTAPKVANAPMQAIEEAGSKIGGGIFRGTKAVAKKLFSAGTGVSEGAIDARLANPSSIVNAAPVSDLQYKLSDSLGTLQNQISEGDKAAWDTLSKSYTPSHLGYTAEDRAIPKENVQSILDAVKKDLSVYGGGLVGKASKQAASTIDSLSEDLGNIGKFSGGKIKSLMGVDSSIPKNQFLPETTVKGIIQSLDQNINWADQTAEPINTALENARTKLDAILKNQNPKYAKAMEPVAEKLGLMKDVQRQFNIKSTPGEGFGPGTATQSNLNNSLNANKSIVQDTLARLKQHTGDDFLSQVQNAKYNQEFQPGMRAQGSRRTLLGGAVGTTIGHFTGSPTLGGMAGAGTGFMMDTQGGVIAGKILDAFSNGPKGALQSYAPQIQKYAPVLMKAINEGAPSLSVANDELMKNDPDYKKWILDLSVADQTNPLFKKQNKPQPLFNKSAQAPQDQPDEYGIIHPGGNRDLAFMVNHSDYKPVDLSPPPRRAKAIFKSRRDMAQGTASLRG